ncbi:hypothetical protein FNV43_RR26465 [Rhamnella rubrinervis]|uniref:Myb-like domain-containing protein n=1 Tax=Rhamnella rubrinervis TaxID=2594499 RepID=A0A8K0DPX0_9ROSA|nr:hypothetical protein FNV43_RR26465 [Rhamnella rubrinervis]
MEFLDEDARPRFVLQSRAPNSSIADSQTDQSNLSKPFLFLTISVSLLLLGFSLFFVQSEPFKSLLLWVALSVLIGPFAPASLTGGDVRVGQGPIVELSPPDTAQAEEETKRVSQKRSKPRRFEDPVVDSTPLVDPNIVGSLREEKKKEVLGKPRRWEVIAEAFGGRFKVETVIKKAKESGEKKLGDADSYAQFLKKRKPVDKRIEDENEESNGGLLMAENGGVSWSSAEDIALLNALKAFPKDVSMRWRRSQPLCLGNRRLLV